MSRDTPSLTRHLSRSRGGVLSGRAAGTSARRALRHPEYVTLIPGTSLSSLVPHGRPGQAAVRRTQQLALGRERKGVGGVGEPDVGDLRRAPGDGDGLPDRAVRTQSGKAVSRRDDGVAGVDRAHDVTPGITLNG